jgi:hypothetical protein
MAEDVSFTIGGENAKFFQALRMSGRRQPHELLDQGRLFRAQQQLPGGQ